MDERPEKTRNFNVNIIYFQSIIVLWFLLFVRRLYADFLVSIDPSDVKKITTGVAESILYIGCTCEGAPSKLDPAY